MVEPRQLAVSQAASPDAPWRAVGRAAFREREVRVRGSPGDTFPGPRSTGFGARAQPAEGAYEIRGPCTQFPSARGTASEPGVRGLPSPGPRKRRLPGRGSRVPAAAQVPRRPGSLFADRGGASACRWSGAARAAERRPGSCGASPAALAGAQAQPQTPPEAGGLGAATDARARCVRAPGPRRRGRRGRGARDPWAPRCVLGAGPGPLGAPGAVPAAARPGSVPTRGRRARGSGCRTLSPGPPKRSPHVRGHGGRRRLVPHPLDVGATPPAGCPAVCPPACLPLGGLRARAVPGLAAVPVPARCSLAARARGSSSGRLLAGSTVRKQTLALESR